MFFDIFKRKNPGDKRLPDHCDLCMCKIALYRPFYTIISAGHFTKYQKDEKMNLCPACFKAYDQYIRNRKEHYIHVNARYEAEN